MISKFGIICLALLLVPIVAAEIPQVVIQIPSSGGGNYILLNSTVYNITNTYTNNLTNNVTYYVYNNSVVNITNNQTYYIYNGTNITNYVYNGTNITNNITSYSFVNGTATGLCPSGSALSNVTITANATGLFLTNYKCVNATGGSSTFNNTNVAYLNNTQTFTNLNTFKKFVNITTNSTPHTLIIANHDYGSDPNSYSLNYTYIELDNYFHYLTGGGGVNTNTGIGMRQGGTTGSSTEMFVNGQSGFAFAIDGSGRSNGYLKLQCINFSDGSYLCSGNPTTANYWGYTPDNIATGGIVYQLNGTNEQDSGGTIGSPSNYNNNYNHADSMGTTSLYGTYASHADSGGTVFGNYAHGDSGGSASGTYSHAESNGVASGEVSHAETGGTATATYSHANSGAVVNGIGSFGSGFGTTINFDNFFGTANHAGFGDLVSYTNNAQVFIKSPDTTSTCLGTLTTCADLTGATQCNDISGCNITAPCEGTLDCSSYDESNCNSRNPTCTTNYNSVCQDNGGLYCAGMSEGACGIYSGGCSKHFTPDYCSGGNGGYCSGNSGCEGYTNSGDCYSDPNGYGSCGWSGDCSTSYQCSLCSGSWGGGGAYDYCYNSGSCSSFDSSSCPTSYGCQTNNVFSSCSTSGACSDLGLDNCGGYNGCSLGSTSCIGSIANTNCNQIGYSDCSGTYTNGLCSQGLLNDTITLQIQAGVGQLNNTFECKDSSGNVGISIDSTCGNIIHATLSYPDYGRAINQNGFYGAAGYFTFPDQFEVRQQVGTNVPDSLAYDEIEAIYHGGPAGYGETTVGYRAKQEKTNTSIYLMSGSGVNSIWSTDATDAINSYGHIENIPSNKPLVISGFNNTQGSSLNLNFANISTSAITATGSGLGTPVCIDANNQLCPCGSCA